MTEKQLEKINILNKLHYAEMKLRSANSIKNNDKKLGRALLKAIPADDSENSYKNYKKEILGFYKNSAENFITAFKEYKKIREDTERLINTVSDEELAAILKYRFIEYKTWEEIASVMYFSVRTAKYKYKKALDKLIV